MPSSWTGWAGRHLFMLVKNRALLIDPPDPEDDEEEDEFVEWNDPWSDEGGES